MTRTTFFDGVAQGMLAIRPRSIIWFVVVPEDASSGEKQRARLKIDTDTDTESFIRRMLTSAITPDSDWTRCVRVLIEHALHSARWPRAAWAFGVSRVRSGMNEDGIHPFVIRARPLMRAGRKEALLALSR